jgi:hypothetical protein
MLVLSTYQCWAGTDHGSHEGGVSGFITVMGGSLIFSKNHMLQVFEKSEPKNLPVPGIWGKKIGIKEQSSISFRCFKPSKNRWVHERTFGSFQFFDLSTIGFLPVL